MKANLFVIGASKCGTTSFYNILRNHPEICMSSVKETLYFALPDNKRKEVDYLSYYNGCDGKKIIGEVTPVYSELHVVPQVPRNIYKYNKNAKIVYLVRNPLDRITSVWKQTLASGHWNRKVYMEKFGVDIPKMSLNFEEAIFDYPPFIEACRYWMQIEGYRKYFPDNQIKVLFFEDLINAPYELFNSLWDFLGVSYFDVSNINKHFNKSSGKVMFKPNSKLLFLARAFRKFSRFTFVKRARHLRSIVEKTFYRPVPNKLLFSENLKNRVLQILDDDIHSICQYTNKRVDFWSF